MKKLLAAILAILLTLVTVTLVIACTAAQRKPEGMTLRSAAFSKETQLVLNALGDDTLFFDYTVDDTIRSMTVEIWRKEAGEWASFGKTSGAIDAANGRFGVRLGPNNHDILHLSSSGYTRYSTADAADLFADTDSTLSSRTDEAQIVDGAAITLFAKYGYHDALAIASGSTDFRESDCDVGLAVTVTFSSKALE